MSRARFAVAAFAASALASCVVPASEPPLPPCALAVDGMLDEPIWTAAQRIDMGGGATLLMIQAPDHLCLGVETRETGLRYVDVFIMDVQRQTHNLHASMQVGERTLPSGRWSDEDPPTAWGQTTQWRANIAPRRLEATDDTPVAELFGPYDGYEFVIERSRMPRPWRLRVEVRDFEGDARDIVWPAGSRRTDPLSWALLQ